MSVIQEDRGDILYIYLCKKKCCSIYIKLVEITNLKIAEAKLVFIDKNKNYDTRTKMYMFVGDLSYGV